MGRAVASYEVKISEAPNSILAHRHQTAFILKPQEVIYRRKSREIFSWQEKDDTASWQVSDSF